MLQSSARLVLVVLFVGGLLGMSAPASSSSEPEPLACVPVEECCKVCDKGKACGNSCIRESFTCHRGRGCACDVEEICE
jgi:hypothetical protein